MLHIEWTFVHCVNAVDNNNENALFLATKSEDRELINTFFEDDYKIDLNQQNNQGDTVLLILALNGIRNIDLYSYQQKGSSQLCGRSYIL